MNFAAARRVTAPSSRYLAVWRERLPGIAIAALLAWFALGLAGGLGDPWARNPLLVAIVLGLAIGNVFGYPAKLRAGLEYTARTLLRLAVVLIGFNVTVRLLFDLGLGPVLAAVGVLAVVFGFVYWLARAIGGLQRELAILLAAGTAVCGAAAVLSVASIMRARPQQAAIAVSAITLFGTVALLVYPVAFLENLLPGLDDDAYGVFVGATIYELAQVYGASYAISELAVNTATLVKLVKVLMLIPLLFLFGLWMRRQGAAAPEQSIPIPWFIVGFVAVMIFNSMITLPGPVRGFIRQVDVFLFLMVMVALGLNTRFAQLRAARITRLLLVGALALGFSAASGYALVRVTTSNAPDAVPAPGALTVNEAAPMPRADRGERRFHALGCAKCHVPSLPAGDRQVVLYSDLLLHDMGPALDDKLTQGEAGGRDWRTTPLVGLGLRKRYLHDGRASSLRDAIIAHGGEATIVRDRYLALSEEQQAELYRFLNSL